MLGRLNNITQGPIAVNHLTDCAPQKQKINIEQELKIGVELVCSFNDKLSQLSWDAQVIIRGWLQEGKHY